MVKKNQYRTKSQRYESCVLQVKGEKGYNPYAVCRSSVYEKNSKYSKSDLRKGTKIELEDKHTSNPFVAEKIAKDHLKENPNYYSYSNSGKEYLVSGSEKKAFCNQ